MFGLRVTGGGPTRAALAAIAALVAGTAGDAAGAPATDGPRLQTDRGCYVVGQSVRVRGSGFAAGREFDLTIDGVDFGQSQTNGFGGFAVTAGPGGLEAGVPQHAEEVSATDGVVVAFTSFTLTRRTGARIIATGGNPNSLRAPFEVWGFSLTGARRVLYLHYVAPNRRVQRTVRLGTVSGQCGYMRTRPSRVFPFSPSPGTWRLQIDGARHYSRSPDGPAATILLRVA